MSISTASEKLEGMWERAPLRVWFGQCGCVEERSDGSFVVYAGGDILGVFDADDVAARDVLMCVVVQRANVTNSDVARAFRVSVATVGRVVTRFKSGGFPAVADTGHRGGYTVRTPQLKRRLFELFASGHGPRAAHRVVRKRASYGVVQSVHQEWLAEQSRITNAIEQIELPVAAANDAAPTAGDDLAEASNFEPTLGGDRTAVNDVASTAGDRTAVHDVAPTAGDDRAAVNDAASTAGDDRAEREDETGLIPQPDVREPRTERSLDEIGAEAGTQIVQHVGSWLMIGMLNALGVYALAEKWRGKSVRGVSLRVAIDALVAALSLGQRCVEGVRRLATPTAGILLRNSDGVTASWTRRVVGKFARLSATMFQANVATSLLKRSAKDSDHVWLYVDNHMRRYSGQEVIRKGWRMQDKRAVPGTTDYYVHDADGCPLWRVATPSHDSLCQWLQPVADMVRMALGDGVTPVLMFDRAGAFAETMAELRDIGAEFVTYERRPYPLLAKTEFDQTLTITLRSRPKKPIVIRYTEAAQKNLRGGRGRVRRIALLMDDDAQINMLAVSSRPAEELIRRYLARWGHQENQLKHGVERWGINQLDGRGVEAYPADAIIPNPARRKLEHQLRLACTAEGEARCRLARLEPDDPKRQRFVDDLERALERQKYLESLRAELPMRAPVRETELAGKLVRHERDYKNVLDTIRAALANAESEFATRLAPHLERPREAKKILANLLVAPGTIHVGPRTVTVRLLPAGSDAERRAFAEFFKSIDRLGLTLPGDRSGRPLRFRLLK
jgi:hypothetical protein